MKSILKFEIQLLLGLGLFLLVLPNRSWAQCGQLPSSYYPTTIASSGMTPAGWDLATTNNTFTWTAAPAGAVSYLYTPPMTGTYNAGNYIWTSNWNWSGYTNSLPVTITMTLGTANADGSGFTSLGTVTQWISNDGSGNGSNPAFTFPVASPVTLTNQVLAVEVQFINVPPATQAPGFNNGMYFTTPIGYTACACPVYDDLETASINDQIIHYNSQTADPAPVGWMDPSFVTTGWSNAVTWAADVTGLPLAGTTIPWFSYETAAAGVSTVPGADSDIDYQLVRHSFTLPTCAVSIVGTLEIAVDDNCSSYINGTLIQADASPTTTLTGQVERTFTLPAGALLAGNNVLAIENNDVSALYIGYTYQLILTWTCSCTTPTDTNTATTTPTNTATNSPTATLTNTVTNTATATPTNTVTNTQTFVFSPTFTNTPTATGTSTVTNTVTNTATQTATNTSTHTATNSATATVTNTITPTPTPTAGISLVKSVSETTAHAGDTLTYSIAVTVSNLNVNGMVITDTLPAGVSFVSFVTIGSSFPGTFYQSTDLLQWTIPSPLAPGSYDLIYKTQVNQFVSTSSPIVNKAQLTYPGQPPLISSAPVTVIGEYTVNVNIYNSAGEVVKTIPSQQFSQAIDNISLPSNTITTLQGPGSTIEIFYEGVLIASWNGSNNSNQPVSNGQYHIQVDNLSAQGVVTSVSQPAIVNRSLSNITANVYNSAGEIVKTLYQVAADPTDLSMTGVSLSVSEFKPSTVSTGPNSQLQIVIQTSGTPVTLTWDGTNNSDTIVTPGEYQIETHWNNGSGQTTDISRQVMVLAGSGPGGTAIARPNVLDNANNLTTTFDATGIPGAYTINVNIYTITGELVRTLSSPAGTAQAQWNANGIASGIYLATVEVLNSNGGVITTQTLKVLLIK